MVQWPKKTLKIQKCEVINLLDRIVKFFSESAGVTKIKIVKQLPDHEIENIYTDPVKLEIVLNNIFSNAIKFVDPENGKILLKLKDKQDSLSIHILDNGIGILKKNLKIIFNRFEQARKERNSTHKGTGIGLAFARQLMQYLKGKIWAESKGQDKGAEFIIELKKGKNLFKKSDFFTGCIEYANTDGLKMQIQNELKQKMQKQKVNVIFSKLNEENEFDYKKAKILVAEDNKDICDIIIKYLMNAGYINFISAADGNLALSRHNPL